MRDILVYRRLDTGINQARMRFDVTKYTILSSVVYVGRRIAGKLTSSSPPKSADPYPSWKITESSPDTISSDMTGCFRRRSHNQTPSAIYILI